MNPEQEQQLQEQLDPIRLEDIHPSMSEDQKRRTLAEILRVLRGGERGDA